MSYQMLNQVKNINPSILSEKSEGEPCSRKSETLEQLDITADLLKSIEEKFIFLNERLQPVLKSRNPENTQKPPPLQPVLKSRNPENTQKPPPSIMLVPLAQYLHDNNERLRTLQHEIVLILGSLEL